MFFTKNFDKILILFFFIFSCWLMWKSFGYYPQTHEFIIARNVVGDFGLHLSLIRSISWGSNFPVESPFFPGPAMPYHYLFDIVVGLLERIGMRIDIALNGLSAVVFTILLYLIYKFPQRLFKKNSIIGILSVLLFLFHSSWAFFDFFRGKTFSLHLLDEIWHIPNYIHAGPFDGSPFSIFFTLNVFVNQRHTVAGLTISLWILYVLLPLFRKEEKRPRVLLAAGLLLGVLGWIHTPIFFGTVLMIIIYSFLYKKTKEIVPVFLPAFLIFLPRALVIVQATSRLQHTLFNPGFLSARPFRWNTFVYYWWLNLGLAIILLPLGVRLAKPSGRRFFVGTFALFIIANTFQLSYRIDHNHTLINIFIIFADFYIAYAIYILWDKGVIARAGFIFCVIILTLSGFLDLMALKNDFRMKLSDAPTNTLMQWIRKNTEPNAIFLAPQQILDPVTLSGRRNYLGHSYYLSVMGYDASDRERKVRRFFEASSQNEVQEMRVEGIRYIILPNNPLIDFLYEPVRNFWKNKPFVYRDREVTIYKL